MIDRTLLFEPGWRVSLQWKNARDIFGTDTGYINRQIKLPGGGISYIVNMDNGDSTWVNAIELTPMVFIGTTYSYAKADAGQRLNFWRLRLRRWLRGGR